MNKPLFSKPTFLHPTSFLIIIFLLASSNADNCSNYKFRNNNNIYTTCNTLPVLNSFLHWNYHQFNHTVDIAYRHTRLAASNWVAWSLNPTGAAMIGSQSLVAFRNSTTGLVRAYTSPISSYTTRLLEGPLSFKVPKIQAEFIDNEMIIYATLQLPVGKTAFTQVWQHGGVSGDTLLMHPTNGDNIKSVASVDFASGRTIETPAASGGETRNQERNVHGVVNVASWGIMMPVGAMAARYLKVFKSANPAWFYLHMTCQTSAYIVGVAGWAIGLNLGDDSPGVRHTTHRNIGLALFILATLQVLSLILRPNPEHKYRFYWNIYHHATGYSVIILSIINVFEGLYILDPEKKWVRAYIGVLIFLGVVAIVLEAFTWYVVIKRKGQPAYDKQQKAVDEANVYGA